MTQISSSEPTAVALGKRLISGRANDIYAQLCLEPKLPDAQRIEYEQQLFGRALTPKEQAEATRTGRAECARMS